jgi:hypothetical protein
MTYSNILQKQPGMVAHACNPSYLGDRDKGIVRLRPPWAKEARLYLKTKTQTKEWALLKS